MNLPIVLGIDPAIASIGYAAIRGTEALDYGAITTKSSDVMGVRLRSIYADMTILIQHIKPDVIGIEQPVFYNRNTNASIVLQALGVIKLAIADAGYPEPVLVTQQQCKTMLGIPQGKRAKGCTVKREVKEAVRQVFEIDGPLKPDDAADGLAIAYAVWQGRSANVA